MRAEANNGTRIPNLLKYAFNVSKEDCGFVVDEQMPCNGLPFIKVEGDKLRVAFTGMIGTQTTMPFGGTDDMRASVARCRKLHENGARVIVAPPPVSLSPMCPGKTSPPLWRLSAPAFSSGFGFCPRIKPMNANKIWMMGIFAALKSRPSVSVGSPSHSREFV